MPQLKHTWAGLTGHLLGVIQHQPGANVLPSHLASHVWQPWSSKLSIFVKRKPHIGWSDFIFFNFGRRNAVSAISNGLWILESENVFFNVNIGKIKLICFFFVFF